MISDKMRDTIEEKVLDYFYDNIEELIEVAEELDYEWAREYDSIDTLFVECFDEDLVLLVEAFLNASLYPNEYDSYSYDDGRVLCSSDRGDIAEKCAEEIIDRIIRRFNNGWDCDFLPDTVIEILKSGECMTADELLEECRCEYVSKVESIKHDINTLPLDEFVKMCRKVAYASEVLDYLQKTKVCGADESMLERIQTDMQGLSLPFEIAREYLENNSGSMVGIKKYTELFVKKYDF